MTIIDRRYSVAEGIAIKAPCRVATTANITLGGLQTIDSVMVVEGDRVLVKSQTDAALNGIYEASTGNWRRTKDFDGAYDVVTGTLVYVNAGTVNGTYQFIVRTVGTITIGTTPITMAAAGRNPGDIPRYEDFGGFPSIVIDSRLIFRNPAPSLIDVWNVGVFRSTGAATGGTPGFVNSALFVATSVDDVVTSFEWNALFKLTLEAAGGGQHCAAYSQLFKNADGTGWAHCVEARDNVVNPTTGTLGMEIGMFVNGTDTHLQRYGIDISIGSNDTTIGTNIVTSAIRIGPTSGNPGFGQLVNGIELSGSITRGLDLSRVNITYSDIGIALGANQKLTWFNSSQVEQATLAWNAAITTWQISGVAVATSASTGIATALPANPNRYLEFQINGDLLRIPAYGT